MNHKNTSELVDVNSFQVNARLVVAEPRLFPVGNPNLILSNQNLVSPFDVTTFGKQLLPLINVNIKEKVKDFARNFNSGADLIEDAIRESWRESPLNPHNFKHLLDQPNLFKHLPFESPRLPRSKPVHSQPASHHHSEKAHSGKKKAPKAIESYSVDGLMKDYGVNGYKHFEQSILRELERQEELKVEATIHTLFEHGDQVKSVEIVNGKPYDSSWKPVVAPTKNYDDDKEVHSQIISPLHTSIFGETQPASVAPHDISKFHDFDHLNSNSIHSTYSVQEEEAESKVKLIKSKNNPAKRKVTPSSSTSKENSRPNSRNRKRHNNGVVKTVEQDSMADSTTSGSHIVQKFVARSNNIQSLTTTKPKFMTLTRNIVDELKKEVTPSILPNEMSTRQRTKSPMTTSTTVKPSRNVLREVGKFVDQARVSGKRGSIKFGQTTKSSQQSPI